MAPMRNREGSYRVLVERPDGKKQLGRPRRDEMIILKWILKKSDGESCAG